MAQKSRTIAIFCCYADKDKDHLNDFKKHLSALRQQNSIDVWDDGGGIGAGAKWDQEIKQHLNKAGIILLLISPDFISSRYSYNRPNTEMRHAWERHRLKEAEIISVVLRPLTGWEQIPFGEIKLGDLQALPTNTRAVTTWGNRDLAWRDVVEGIERVIKELTPPPAKLSKVVPPSEKSDSRSEEISTLPVGSTSSSGNGAPSQELIDQELPPPTRGERFPRRKLLARVVGGIVTISGIGGIILWILRPHPLYTYRGHSASVYSVAWSPDSKRIASASADMTVQVWNAADGGNVYIYRGHADFVGKVAWSPDGRRIASGSGGGAGKSDTTVQVWDAVDGSHAYIYSGYANEVRAIAWSPDGRRIASTDGDNTIQVWDEATGGNAFTYRGHSGGVYAVAWSPSIDSRLRIASGGNDTTVQVWDAVDGSHVYIYYGNAGYVKAVAWSPNGKRIASGGSVVQVWDAEDGSHVYTYRGHAEVIYSVAWSVDGRHIASAGGDKTVQIWDAENGDHINTYHSYTHEVAWSPDGQRIAFANDDGTVQIWQAM